MTKPASNYYANDWTLLSRLLELSEISTGIVTRYFIDGKLSFF